MNGNRITRDFTINSISHLSGAPTYPTSKNYVETCADTGATGHFFTTALPISNLRPTTHPIAIRNPNGSLMHSTHEAELDLPQLPLLARRVHIVPELQSRSLLSIAQLCDADCKATFTRSDVHIHHNGTCILSGQRDPATQLWHVNVPTRPSPVSLPPGIPPACNECNKTIGLPKVADMVAFAHASLFSPTLSTLAKALQSNFLTNFPGLTIDTLCRHPPQSKAMIMGHLNQTCQGLCSTRTTLQNNNIADIEPTETDDDEENHDAFPNSKHPNDQMHACYASTMEITGQVYSDQTGRFVAPSDRGNQYLFVMYNYNSNSIHAEPIKNCTATSILAAYKTVHQCLCTAGLKPKLQRLDNKCSQILKDYMIDQGVHYQLVSPHVHRRNAAERAIRTFKNHFIAGLCSVDHDFPIHLWDRLLPQALLTLNLLRGSCINPKLSAYAQIFGTFDHNQTPLAPPGIHVMVHQKPSNQLSWGAHAIDGWYIRPALESYHCYRVWIWETHMERICDTLEWFPTKVPLPTVSNSDLILAALQDILRIL